MIMPFIRLVIIYIVVILAAVLFFNRDKVMPLLGFGGEKTAAMSTASAPTPAADSAADETSGEAADTPDDRQADAAGQPAALSSGQPAVQPIQQPVAEEPSAEQPPKYPTADTAQVATPDAQPQPAPSPAPAAGAKPAMTPDMDTRLNKARQAYWNRDLAGAEASYKNLAQDFPDNADIKGELGNLYYAQRRNAEAAEMYHQAGLLLIKQGNPQQVMLLIGVLQAIAPDKATDLRQRLSQ